MLVLSIETATTRGSLALAKISPSGFEILSSKTWLRQRSHGELVTLSVEELLQVSGHTVHDIDAILVDHGPGSFTGIRVGLNFARTLAYSLNKPLYSWSSLEVLAHAVPTSLLKPKSALVAMINAHKNQCYTAVFEAKKVGWAVKKKIASLSSAEVDAVIKKSALCVGEGYSVFCDQLKPSTLKKLIRDSTVSDFPHAETMVQIFSKSHRKLKPKSWRTLGAVYIRGSEAEEKLKAGILKPLPKF